MSPPDNPATPAATATSVQIAEAVPALHLLYHELRPIATDYSYVIPTGQFAQHLDLFTSLLHSPGATLRPAITFDDGHVSNLRHALPLLSERSLRARFFITVGWTGNKPGYMNWQELRTLHAAGQHIGAHGWTHTLLTHCSPAERRHELLDARLALEDKLGDAITTMSLPGGRSDRAVLESCREAGYTRVFTSVPQAEVDPHAFTVGRLNLRSGLTLPWIARLFEPGSDLLHSLERQDRIKGTLKSVLGDHLYARLWALLNREEAQETEAASDAGTP